MHARCFRAGRRLDLALDRSRRALGQNGPRPRDLTPSARESVSQEFRTCAMRRAARQLAMAAAVPARRGAADYLGFLSCAVSSYSRDAVGSPGVKRPSQLHPVRRSSKTLVGCDARLARLMAVTTLRTTVA